MFFIKYKVMKQSMFDTICESKGDVCQDGVVVNGPFDGPARSAARALNMTQRVAVADREARAFRGPQRLYICKI